MTSLRLCVRNLPCKVLEEDFRNSMQGCGLDVSRYQVRMPKRKARNGKYNNFGYAFVSCGHAEDVERFFRAFEGFRFETIQSSKSLSIEPASAAVHSMDLIASSSNWASSFDSEVGAHESAPESHDVEWRFWSHAISRGGFAAQNPSEDIPEHWVMLSAPESTSSRESVSMYPRVPYACELPLTRLAAAEGAV